jgi:hypothetical protein
MSERHPLDPSVVRAEHDGVCPLCTKYVAAGRSWIAALREPLPLTLDHVFYDADRGHWRWRWYGGPDPVQLKSRRWAHAACQERHEEQTAGQDQRAIAAARRKVLADHKKARIKDHRTTGPRREGGS